MVQSRLFLDDVYWTKVVDGDPDALRLFERHYSYYQYKDGRSHKRFVGPGERLVLLGKNKDALFVWRKFYSRDGQTGVNCSIFRNESAVLSSDLILQAEVLALRKWGPMRFYTYVNPRKVNSRNPGYCFISAGWRKCGRTKARNLLILEKNLMS
jgi:hypothetical protein